MLNYLSFFVDRCVFGVAFFTGFLAVLVLGGCNNDKTISVAFVGDTALGVSPMGERAVRRMGHDGPFKFVKQSLEKSDFIIGNLETPIVDSSLETIRTNKVPRQIPGVEYAFARHNFYALGLANNHAMDYGATGLKQTIKRLNRVGIKTFGAGTTLDESRQPLIVEKKGIRIGILGYCQKYRNHDFLFATASDAGVAYLENEMLEWDIRQLKKRVDFVVVYPHWGGIFREVLGVQRHFAKVAIGAGADLVVGHHPHIPQEMRILKGAPVLYSLGNFIFHGIRSRGFNSTLDQDYSIVANVTFSKSAIKNIELTPYFNNNRRTGFVPQVAGDVKAKRLFEKLLAPFHNFHEFNKGSAFLDVGFLKCFAKTKRDTPLVILGHYIKKLPKVFPTMAIFFAFGAVISLTLAFSARQIPQLRVLSKLGLPIALVVGVGGAWTQRALFDDAFISFRYARNFLEGHGLVYNIGERVEGYTNFLWTLLVAILSFITRVEIPIVGFFGSLITFAACLVTIFLVGRKLRTENERTFYVPIAAAWLAAQYTFHSFGTTGLETMFATMLVCIGAGFVIGKPTPKKAMFAGSALILATLARPDHGIFYGCMGAAIGLHFLTNLIKNRKDRIARRDAFISGIRAVGSYALPFLGYLLYLAWKLWYYGEIVPNTYWAKSAGMTYWEQGAMYAVEFLLTSHIGLLLVPFFLWVLLSKGQNIKIIKGFFVFSVAVYTLYIIKIGGDFMEGRFFVPLMPMILLGIEDGSYRLMARTKYKPAFIAVIIGLLAALTVRVPLLEPVKVKWHLADENTFFQLKSLSPLKIGPKNKNANLLTVPSRLQESFVDTGLNPVLGSGGIGIVGYYSQLELVDIRGLVDPYVARLPLKERRRPGHEKRAPQAYLDARNVRIMRGHANHFISPFSRLTYQGKPLGFFFLYRYDKSFMEEVAEKSPDLSFTDFPRWLDITGRRFLREDLLKVAQRLKAYDHYYFSLNEDPKRRTPYENRFIQLLDFEDDQYPEGSQSQGAFTSGLVRPAYDGDYNIWDYQGNTLIATSKKGKGLLKLPEFEIAGDTIGFLVGGATHPDLVSVSLEIDNKSVLYATGKRLDGLDFVVWDVSKYRGQTGRIILRDSSKKHRMFFDMFFEGNKNFAQPMLKPFKNESVVPKQNEYDYSSY